MAFLCPVRIGRSKKKKSVSGEIDKDLTRSNSGLGLNHGLGRITGSASIETLVRVGIEKEAGLSPDSKMVVLHDFTPCVDDELEVKRGQIVNILYRENDWVYVIGQDTRQEGFIPYSYCTPYNTQLADLAIKKKLPRTEQMLYFGNENANDKVDANAIPTDSNNDTNNNNEGNSNNNEHNNGNINNKMSNTNSGENNEHNNTNMNNKSNNPTSASELIDLSAAEILDDNTMSGLIGLQNSMLKHSHASLSSDQDYIPFAKDICGRYIVLYTFIARDENDVSVERGEFVTVLNREDPEWFWIVRSDGQEGFIPSGFVYPADNILQNSNTKPSAQSAYNSAMNQLNDARQLQNQATDAIVNNDTCQAHNIQMATGIGHVNNAINDQTTMINTAANNNSNNTNSQVQVPQQQQQQQQQQLQPQQSIIGGSEDLRYHGTELVMLYDYKAQAPDDLSVRRGDWIYADLNNQTVDGWLWAYAPKTRKYGFIPKAYARTPAMTSL